MILPNVFGVFFSCSCFLFPFLMFFDRFLFLCFAFCERFYNFANVMCVRVRIRI